MEEEGSRLVGFKVDPSMILAKGEKVNNPPSFKAYLGATSKFKKVNHFDLNL